MAQEQELQQKIMEFLLKEKIFAFKVINATTAGHTDITACLYGNFIGIEVKAENGIISPLQEYTHKRLIKSGGAVFVVRPSNFDTFKKQIQQIKSLIEEQMKSRTKKYMRGASDL